MAYPRPYETRYYIKKQLIRRAHSATPLGAIRAALKRLLQGEFEWAEIECFAHRPAQLVRKGRQIIVTLP